jgi:excisionase family DNA binding protein
VASAHRGRCPSIAEASACRLALAISLPVRVLFHATVTTDHTQGEVDDKEQEHDMSERRAAKNHDVDEVMTPLALRPADVQRLTGLSGAHIARLIASGELRSFKSGRARLIAMADLRRWIEQQVA